MEKSNGEIEPDGIRNVNGDMQGQDEIGIASDDGETHELTYERRNGFVRYDKSLKNLIPIRRKKRDDGTLGVDSAGLVSTFTFSWLTKILYDAHNKGIKMDELPALSPFDGGTYNARRLELMWEEELARKGPEKASFSNVTWRFCRTRILATCVIFIGSLIASLVCYTYLMQRLLEYVQSSDESYTEGAKWVLLLIIVGIIRTFLFSGCLSMCFRTALRLRSACLTFLYAKIIRLDNLGNKNIGKVINTFSNDAQKIFDMILVAPLVVGAPISTAFGIAYILWLLGPMALIGMIALFLFFPMQHLWMTNISSISAVIAIFQYVISQVTDYFQTKAVEISDMRVRVIGEILDCIKLIKMYAWEKRFSDELLGLREKEGRNLLKTTYLWTLCFSISPAFPVISAIMTFIIHASIGNNLLASQVFPWKTFLDSGISLTLLLFQEGIGCIIPGRISIDRIKSLLLLEKGNCVITKPIVKSQALAITNGTFAYDTFDDQETEGTQSNGKKRDNEAINSGEKSEQETLNKPTEKADCVEVLFDVSFEAEKGKLIGICGTVGSGKSSLLLAALGQLRILEGQVTRDGSCAYVSQQAWISNATLRENILFGAKFDRSRYDKTIYACNLSQDIDMMPGGDQTEIGEKGINLSGGQKQRVALARALYADRDIYLLDDPLSAVDACVGSYLFDNLILGALRGKTVLFVTHQIQYLNRCDEIYMMRDGKIMERGTHEELMKLGNEYALMVAAISTDDDSEEEIIVDKIITDIPETIETIPPHEKKRSIVSSVGSRVSVKSIENVNTTDALLTVAEDIQDGSVKADTYHSYIMAAGGYCTLIIVILTFLTSATSIAFGSWWLAFWIDAGGGNTTIVRDNETIISDNVHDNPNFSYYRTIYASTIGVILITCAVRCYIYSKATIRASTKMHNDLFKKVITSPMRFFDTTPSGRIQHLFSRDMDEVDNKLPVSLMVVVDNGIRVFFCFVVICVVFPWFLLPLCILAVLYYYIAKVFRTGIRDLKRMDNKARTVLISFATASIQGLSTIHAFGKESEFMTKFTKLFDENSKFLFMYNGALRWLSVRIDGLSVVITGITAMLMVILKGEISPALAGLALTYAMLISDICQSTVKLLTETEVRLINVERLNTYAKTLVSESNMSRPPTVQPRPTWPEAAEIKFINVCMAYGENAPLILKNVSFSIGAGEKIGIVGRTGSGKSSLTVALFRLVELAEGKIEIDDVDISDISHSQLRSKLSIIPQDPVLFSGTIRSNLDPFKLYTDAEIWEALEKTELKSRVQSIAGQLDATVGFGGDNISVGERQLLCLSRALLRNSKILVLDEATAAVDPETEIAVQKTIQEEFSHCTILTIAHRLQTVLSLNRILVMDSGRVLEFDTPSNLLEDSNSMFSKMIAAAEKAEGQ